MSKRHSFECPQCSRIFLNKYSQTQHIRSIHGTKNITRFKNKQFFGECKVCKICMKEFVSFEELKFHKKNVHPKQMQAILKGNNYFECHDCNKKFVRKYTLRRHLKVVHLLDRDIFECAYCSMKFTRKNDLSRHIISKENTNPKIKHFKCLMCEQSFSTRSLINEHYQKYHNIDFVYDHLKFTSLNEFEKWKIDVEQKCFIQFSVAISWKTKMFTVKQYVCHRSGEKRLKSAPKVIPKLIGSKKLGGICPALITTKKSKIDGMCSVVYQKIHIGHPCDKSELPYMSLNGEVVNITQQYNFNKPFPMLYYNHNNTASFVLNNQNSILFYKAKGIKDNEFPTLKKEDFALGYMNENQELKFKRHGYKTICFDGTYGINSNDYILHTILVADVDSEGSPVAFLLTNRNDDVVISVLLEKIKNRLGTISPKSIMSDMQMFYFNSWINTMGPVKHSLFCLWHVHKAWLKNLSKIKNKEKKKVVIKILYDLSTELDKDKFQKKLHTFISNNDDDLQYFLDYFFQNFAQNQHYWAYCYRQNDSCNINLESFHRVKQKIRGRLKVESIYDYLFYLEKYLTMKENDLQKKQICFKRTTKLKLLRANHKKVEKQSESKNIVIKSSSCNSWRVQSFTDENIIYNVLKSEIRECTMYEDMICLLPCTKCKTCFHNYTCSCHDQSIKNNMCKHIHAVGMYLLSKNQIVHVGEERMQIANTDVVQTSMAYKNNEPMETTHMEHKVHQDNGNWYN
ncbi:Hypothetical protein CINCED_3A014603 [Cinara cedri]|uniref:Uncharacterized protein n=1 Tax=Cinara cedri TaxID=506608 RepID=A0A5E4M7K3_9HEMI|nr:Hypothetical protein CINCED_3A014603 [Cinara cedri]